MSECSKDLYAATCNPARRAKRTTMVDPAEQSSGATSKASAHPRSILPMPSFGLQDGTTGVGTVSVQPAPSKRGRKSSSETSSQDRPYTPRISALASTAVDPPPPAKRGRKPGPLSKTAREAQRRLNHSIIEKARRTKINDALATLKQLIPSDYLQVKQKDAKGPEDAVEDEEEEDDETPNQKPKNKPKKEDKEFKLEILERTVAFLQDLLEKVDTLEANAPVVCHSCGVDVRTSKKRKHVENEGMYGVDASLVSGGPRAKSRRIDAQQISQSPSLIPYTEVSKSSPAVPSSRGSSTSPATFAIIGERERLPSISSWLSEPAEIDPQLPPPPLNKRSRTEASTPNSHLPSPPSSTLFDPIRNMGTMPMLNLGPVATSFQPPSNSSTSKGSSSSSSSNTNGAARTPEDESAASMLLHIATSPLFRPSSTSVPVSDPSAFSLHSVVRSQMQGMDTTKQAQTPSSLLGMRKA